MDTAALDDVTFASWLSSMLENDADWGPIVANPL